MKRLFLIATMATLAMAKPGQYKEKEDFQYSRSSTDEGSKAGFYGAQRGNMGGNYERAHNMDGLAQNQMSGLVRQVEGELGEGSKTRSGSVFTAANSRGVYGSGHYDLKNLEGRNFEEGVSFDDSQSQSLSQSHSSLATGSAYNAHASSYGAHSSDYNAQSSALDSATFSGRHSDGSKLQRGYNVYQHLGHNGVESNLQQSENLNAANQHDYGGQEATGYFSQSAYNGQSAYDQSRSNQYRANAYGSNAQTRLATAMPVKVILRPGTVPISTQTYDSSNSAAYDHNSVNNDAELLSYQNQHNNNYKPTGAKHYESSYSYRKEWEKHDALPVTVLPTVVSAANPIPKNSELYEDAQSHLAGQQYESTGVDSQNAHSQRSNSYGGYNANIGSASLRQSHHQSAYNAHHHRSASAAASDSSASSQGTYNFGVGADTTNQVEDLDSKPKSYHSSYSYHKSWERQGDPYVIKPASSGYDTQASQSLTAASGNQGTWSSHRYGSRYQQHAHQNALNLEDCDENGHIRTARSYNTNQYEEQNAYQQNQYNYDQELFSQQSQNLEDLTQQTQNKWEKIEDLGQQTQNKWDKTEDLGQQTQNKWDKIEDLGQQTQNKWDKTENLQHQSLNKWDQSEDLGQQAQNIWDQSGDLRQQTQTQWDKLEDDGQQTQSQWDKLEDIGQQTQAHFEKLEDVGQQTQNKWDHFDGQQSQLDDGQQLQNTWSQLESSSYHGVGQETQTNWGNLNIPTQEVVSESVTPDYKPRLPLDKESDRLPIGIVPISKELNENNKKPSIPNTGTQESNIFSLHRSTSPKEQPVQSSTIKNEDNPDTTQNQLNKIVNTPFNNINKYWQQSDNSNPPTPGYNKYIHPWFNQFPYSPQSSEQEQNSNSYNQQSSISQNPWDESFINHHYTSEIKPLNVAQDTSTLWNLWDKVDSIEKQTMSSNTNNTDVSQHSVYSQIKPIPEQISRNHNSVQQPIIQNKPLIDQYGNNFGQPQDFNKETTTREETPTFSATTTINTQPQGDILQPADVGRGDIGPEDAVSGNTPQFNNQEIFNVLGIHTKPDIFVPTTEHIRYKTPAEIEALSQVIVNDKITTEKLAVVSSTTSRAITGLSESDVTYLNMGKYSDNTVTVEDGKSTSISQSNLEQSVDDFGQQSHNFEQKNMHQLFPTLQKESDKLNDASPIPPKQIEKMNKPIHKAETEKNDIVPVESSNVNNANMPARTLQQQWQETRDSSVSSNKFLDKLDKGNTPVPENNFFNYPWFHQLPHKQQNDGETQAPNSNNQQFNTYNNQELNIRQESANFDQQNTDQKFETFDQQNTDQQLETFDQLNENRQINKNFGQESENFGQQSENFGQQSENFGQQSENFGQQSEKFDRQNTYQQFETFDQLNENRQINKNFGQESENFGQQSENFGQQSENFGQQSENIGQQSENFGQQSENFGQQSEKFDENIDFEQLNENFEQESENLGQKNDNLSQNSDQQFESFDQQVGKEQAPIEQEFEQLEQQVNKFNTEHVEKGFINFPPKTLDDKTNVQETQNLQVIPVKSLDKLEIPDDRALNTQTLDNKDVTLTSATTDTSPESDNTKPGFWKSVGNKFVSAKDKVFSWFS